MGLTWTKNLETTDGRFSIVKTGRGKGKAPYVLFDRSRQDSCLPEYTWSTYAYTIASAKDKADRIARGVFAGA